MGPSWRPPYSVCVPSRAGFITGRYQQRFAVRKGDHKLVIPGPGKKPELYHLAKDIAETNNLAASHPERLAELEKLRAAWTSELIDPVFLGLIHTNSWKKKSQRAKQKKPATPK